MSAIILEQQPQKWSCPACPAYAVTFGQPNRYHNCAGLAGLLTPMVPAGQRCKVEVHERQDYIGNEDVQLDDNGRPIMSVVVTREGGEDVTVYAPTAYLRGEA